MDHQENLPIFGNLKPGEVKLHQQAPARLRRITCEPTDRIEDIYYRVVYGRELGYQTSHLEGPGTLVSQVPSSSLGYFDCCGFTAFQGEGLALYHYNEKDLDVFHTTPEAKIQGLLRRLAWSRTSNDIRGAVVWGGIQTHIDRILDVFHSQQVPILNLDPDRDPADYKGVIVLPSNREVILFSQKRGFIRLN